MGDIAEVFSVKDGACYSDRSASSGSIRDARQAGTPLATPATTSSVTATAANVSGSVGPTP
jgi:hypothetical protein